MLFSVFHCARSIAAAAAAAAASITHSFNAISSRDLHLYLVLTLSTQLMIAPL
jgi:hypothetical protein